MKGKLLLNLLYKIIKLKYRISSSDIGIHHINKHKLFNIIPFLISPYVYMPALVCKGNFIEHIFFFFFRKFCGLLYNITEFSVFHNKILV